MSVIPHGKCWAAALLAGILAWSCASITPPPRFSTISPADASAPESVVAPAAPILTGAGELADAPAPTPTPTPEPKP